MLKNMKERKNMDFFGNNDYSYGLNTNALVGLVICIVLAFAGGIVLYCTFLSKKNNGKFKGFLGWLYDTLSFNSLLMELLLKICYLITAGFITLYSIVLLFTPGSGFLVFLILIIFGNIGVRIMYEFMLILIIICRNTSEINKTLSGPGGNSTSPSFGPAAFKTSAQAPNQQPYAPAQASPQPPVYQPPVYQQPAQQPQQAPVYQQPGYEPPVNQQPAADQPSFCPECGTKLEPGAAFCPNCGAQLS